MRTAAWRPWRGNGTGRCTLLTDEEIAAGEGDSKALPDAFSEFPDPVPTNANP